MEGDDPDVGTERAAGVRAGRPPTAAARLASEAGREGTGLGAAVVVLRPGNLLGAGPQPT